jgi:hypothetical protein
LVSIKGNSLPDHSCAWSDHRRAGINDFHQRIRFQDLFSDALGYFWVLRHSLKVSAVSLCHPAFRLNHHAELFISGLITLKAPRLGC